MNSSIRCQRFSAFRVFYYLERRYIFRYIYVHLSFYSSKLPSFIVPCLSILYQPPRIDTVTIACRSYFLLFLGWWGGGEGEGEWKVRVIRKMAEGELVSCSFFVELVSKKFEKNNVWYYWLVNTVRFLALNFHLEGIHESRWARMLTSTQVTSFHAPLKNGSSFMVIGSGFLTRCRINVRRQTRCFEMELLVNLGSSCFPVFPPVSEFTKYFTVSDIVFLCSDAPIPKKPSEKSLPCRRPPRTMNPGT